MSSSAKIFTNMHLRIKSTPSKNNSMRNISRSSKTNAWRVQLMHKRIYYCAVFSDSKHNNCWAQSAVAAKMYLLNLRSKLKIYTEV